MECELEVEVLIQEFCFGDGPWFESGQAVHGCGGVIFFHAEPWETDGHASAEGAGGVEMSFTAEEDDGFLSARLVCGDMSAVEVDFAACGFAGDLCSGKVGRPGIEAEDAGDAELVVE